MNKPDREAAVEQIAATIDRQAPLIMDMARHVSDQVHDLVKRHAVTMPTVSAAVALGVVAAAQILCESILFGHNSMEQDPEDEGLIREAGFQLFGELVDQAFPGAIAIVDGAAPPA